MYTVILILTCLVASPFIYKQIWETSSVKQPKAAKKEPTVSTVEATTEAVSEQPETETDPSEAEPTSSEADAEPTTAKPVVTEDAEFVTSTSEYFSDALFIGDSRTVGIKDYGTIKNASYFCSVGLAAYKIGSENINGYSLSDMLSGDKYGKIYIMLGINEVANDVEYTIGEFRKLLDTVKKYQPDAIVYLEGNLHVTIAAQTQNITNEGIDLLNSRLEELAAETENVYFLNINEVFDDETGALTPDFTSDGIHVLGKYYQTWCEWLLQHTISEGKNEANGEAEVTTTAAATEAYSESNDTYADYSGNSDNNYYEDYNSYDDSGSNDYYSGDDDGDSDYNDEY